MNLWEIIGWGIVAYGGFAVVLIVLVVAANIAIFISAWKRHNRKK